MDVQKGVIKGFRGNCMSGLATLLIEDEEGCIDYIHCDNAPTVRALEACFGDVIGEGHTVKPDGKYIDQEIYYSMDEMGLILEAFTPVDEASDELKEAYEKNKEED